MSSRYNKKPVKKDIADVFLKYMDNLKESETYPLSERLLTDEEIYKLVNDLLHFFPQLFVLCQNKVAWGKVFNKISKKLNENYHEQLGPNPSVEISKGGLDRLAENYYGKLKEYDEKNSNLYSIGDSLEKLNFVWSLKNNKIKNIPFSGSMFDLENDLPVFNENKYTKMKTFYKNFKEHNKIYRDLIEDIKSNKPVVIIDYGAYGRAIATLLLIFRDFENLSFEELSRVRFLIMTTTFEDSDEGKQEAFRRLLLPFEVLQNRYLLEFAKSIIDPIFDFPSRYYTNSDSKGLQARCIPSYPVEKWNEEIEQVWWNEYTQSPNYILCNINRILFLLQMCEYL